MIQRQQSAHRTRRFALFFGIIIILFIVAAFSIKVALMIARSHFDGAHQFILQIQNPTKTKLLIFSPGNNSLSEITLSQVVNKQTLIKHYAIPVDGTVTAVQEENPKDFTRDLLFHFHSFHASFTFFDAIRFFFFAQGVIPQNIHMDSIILSSDSISLQQKINKDLMDSTLYKESVSVAIINSTGVSGLGNNIALLLSHTGANVISVTSSQQLAAHSHIVYSGQTAYTLERIEQLLQFPLQKSTTAGVADITVIIGTDDAERFAP